MKNITIEKPEFWKSYELLDSGDFEKLEKFGSYILRRPEPQAVWGKSLSGKEWETLPDAYFKKDKGNAEKGLWLNSKRIPEKWVIPYKSPALNLQFKIALSAFKHVGLFPEQATNWEFIASQCKQKTNPKVLNLFAYTGIASSAARQSGAEITHLDAVKQVVSWAKENMELSNLNDIRWIVDDAMTYLKREVKRGKIYDGIILDPPAYGRGPNGEKWVLEENIFELITLSKHILAPNGFLILNVYSLGFSSLIVENLLNQIFQERSQKQTGELFLEDKFSKKLPLGVYGRVF